eukprot:TRINITY_DN62809_c0_g1_i1.p1 TRINITY_DN62809_c0_g1~~TRINITY_DN62809_c0_g1_i1.p1  ORF type:complete len:175 (-),score=46.81 TRINITY_DN62809_c0_g1_i1:22-513(-)
MSDGSPTASATSNPSARQDAGRKFGCLPPPARMDDWSRLDYYRFCLFQRQVQEEFLRENLELRSSLCRSELSGGPSSFLDKSVEDKLTDDVGSALAVASPDVMGGALAAEEAERSYQAALDEERKAWAAAEAAWALEDERDNAGSMSRVGSATGSPSKRRRRA